MGGGGGGGSNIFKQELFFLGLLFTTCYMYKKGSVLNHMHLS